jgi:hypothetical protein
VKDDKIPNIFRLPNLFHIAVRAYKAQNGLTQCHNCQQFVHVWLNCKQASSFLQCGGCLLQNRCPEKGTISSILTCCNCQLAEGEKLHPANYRGCRHAKEQLQKRTSQRTPKTTTGREFTSSPLLACPSRRRSEAGQRNRSSLRRIRWQWQVPPQWNPGSLRPYPITNSRQLVSQFWPLI